MSPRAAHREHIFPEEVRATSNHSSRIDCPRPGRARGLLVVDIGRLDRAVPSEHSAGSGRGLRERCLQQSLGNIRTRRLPYVWLSSRGSMICNSTWLARGAQTRKLHPFSLRQWRQAVPQFAQSQSLDSSFVRTQWLNLCGASADYSVDHAFAHHTSGCARAVSKFYLQCHRAEARNRRQANSPHSTL